MKNIKVKISIFMLAICCALFGAGLLFATQDSQLSNAYAQEFSQIAMVNYNSIAPDKRQYKPAEAMIDVVITGKTNDPTAETTNVK